LRTISSIEHRLRGSHLAQHTAAAVEYILARPALPPKTIATLASGTSTSLSTLGDDGLDNRRLKGLQDLFAFRRFGFVGDGRDQIVAETR
jgi:hypothetical protein